MGSVYQKVAKVAKLCRDEKARGKIQLFLKAFEIGSVLKACREMNTYGRYYYYWWNRFRDSGFKVQALQEKSRRPKRIARKTAPDIVQAIKTHRKEKNLTPDRIQLTLLKEKKIRVSRSTIYRVLWREKLPLRKRTGSKPSPSPQPSRSREPLPLIPLLTKEGNTRVVGDRYLLEKELGSGGGGMVYLAQDQKSQRQRVALKIIESSETQDSSLDISLKNEFSTLSSLHHQNLARVFDFGRTDREMYFTSEWIEGEDILQVSEKANHNTVFQLIIQILRALDFLHRHGVLHLDLKPSNILVTDPNRAGDLTVKLIDFGSAEWVKKGLKLKGEFVGTPPYASPEIIQEQPPTPGSDIYALGMILHQIFAKRFPLSAQEPFEMMKEQMYQEPLKITHLNPALPDDFSDVLLKMVARTPSSRFQSSQEVLEALNQCLGENYSLRSSAAPIRILEESEFLFRWETFQNLMTQFSRLKPQVILLSGPKGAGKSYLLRRLKESLQLKGVHPLLLNQRKPLEEFLELDQKAFDSPLFIDLEEEVDLISLLDSLENLNLPVVMTTRQAPTPMINPNEWIHLAPLNQEVISAFLKQEIIDFPPSGLADQVQALSHGSLSELETVLQAMREEGMFQWTSQGWRWVAEPDFALADLLPKQEARWEGRLQRIKKILKSFPHGMSAKTLEGVLSLEPTTLEEKLMEWESKGEITSKVIRKIPIYFLKTKDPSPILHPMVNDWTWAEKELQKLYDEGAFEAGVEWANLLILEEKKSKKIPTPVALLIARHYVAAGHGEEALKALPSPPRDDVKSLGLFYEIRARALVSQGHLEKALEALKEGERSYRTCKDRGGISRIFNLYGLIYKRMGDFSSAENSFKSSIRAAEEFNDAYHQGISQMNLGIFYQDQGQFQEAYEIYKDTFPLEAKANQPLLSSKLRHNWANLLIHMGRSSEAEGICYELLKISVKYRYSEQQAAALNFLALLAAEKNHRDLQLTYLNQALSLLNPFRYPQLYFETLISRGYLFWSSRKFTPAQLDAEAAFNIAERVSNTFMILTADLLLGKILRDRPKPDLEKATHYLNDAHQLIWKNQFQQRLWEVEFERGLLAKKKGEHLRARNYFLNAEKELKALLLKVPETVRQSYLRDRKLEDIFHELKILENESK